MYFSTGCAFKSIIVCHETRTVVGVRNVTVMFSGVAGIVPTNITEKAKQIISGIRKQSIDKKNIEKGKRGIPEHILHPTRIDQ